MRITKIQIKILFFKLIPIAAALFSLSVIFISMKNLGPSDSANVLERITGLAGIILIAPLCYPEEKGNIMEILMIKRIRPMTVYTVRLVIGALLTGLVAFVLIVIMRSGNCSFPLGHFFIGTIASSFFIGAVGFCISAVTYNTAAGILTSTAYFIFNMFTGDKIGVFYLFSLSTGSYKEKVILGIAGIILSAVALAFGKNGELRYYSGK